MECQVCGKAADTACQGCHALFYCGKKHRSRHARFAHTWEECCRMREQMERFSYDRMSSFFPWPVSHVGDGQGTAASEEGRSRACCAILKAAHCHGIGIWRRVCPCFGSKFAPWGALGCPPEYQIQLPAAADEKALESSLQAENSRVQSPSKSPYHRPATQGNPSEEGWDSGPMDIELLLQMKALPAEAFLSWEVYCQARQVQRGSILPLLLSKALTAAAALRDLGSLVPQDCDGRIEHRPSRIVHWLGPEDELDQIPALLEVSTGIETYQNLVIRLVGPAVPASWDGMGWRFSLSWPLTKNGTDALCESASEQAAAENNQSICEITCHSGVYHELFAPPSKSGSRCGQDETTKIREVPDVIYAPNAGLQVYESWEQTVAMLCCPDAPPCIFSDYSEEAALQAALLIESICEKQLAGAANRPTSNGLHQAHRPQGRCRAESGLNPLMHPTAADSGTALPTFSNGWILKWNWGLGKDITKSS